MQRILMEGGRLTSQKPKSRARPQRPLTEERLKNGAYFYLGRYASNSARLEQVLRDRVRRAAMAGRCDEAEAMGWVGPIVQKCVELKLVDDESFAAMRARSLMRRGKGPRYIEQDLAQRGLMKADIEAALASLPQEAGEDPALHAAKALLRRRRLGAYRTPEKREAAFDKDMGALARAGISLTLARTLLKIETVEELENYFL